MVYMTLATLVAIRDLRDTALILLSVYGQTSRRRTGTAVTEEDGDLRNGPWPWTGSSIGRRVKHREAARDGFGGLRGGEDTEGSSMGQFCS